MAHLNEIVTFCDEQTRRREFVDFPGAENGLQLENNGEVTKIGAAVDGGSIPLQQAAEKGIDFLICHHGLYWNPPIPLVGPAYQKVQSAMQANIAVYSSHLPLDAHPEIGNNALLARELQLNKASTFLNYEGTDIGLITEGLARAELKKRLQEAFPQTLIALEFGPENPEKIAILTGSGAGAVDHLPDGVDTLVTGELKQHHFNQAQEMGLNLFLGGHYGTEVFGVKALAEKVAQAFQCEWEFLDTGCPL